MRQYKSKTTNATRRVWAIGTWRNLYGFGLQRPKAMFDQRGTGVSGTRGSASKTTRRAKK